MKSKNTLIIKNLKWIILLVMIISFSQLIISIQKDTIAVFDDFCYDKVSLLISDKMSFFVKIITNFGSAFTLITITLLIMLLLKTRNMEF